MVSYGYWPTIQLVWHLKDNPIEIEVFQDHYEFYQFFDGETAIQHVDACHGSFPEPLKELLNRALPRPQG